MTKCIYSGQEFNESDGEHILQNFLGARWTSHEIVCNEVQVEFGRTIDVSLERGLHPLRNLLGTKGGRGNSGPMLKGLSTTQGERVTLPPGKAPSYSEPTVIVSQQQDSRHKVQMRMSSIKQLGWALAKLRHEHPNLTVSEEVVRPLAKSVTGFLSGQIEIPIILGGDDFFRGALKSCFNLLGVIYPLEVHKQCFNLVRHFVHHGSGHPANFIRWPKDDARLNIEMLGRADQFIGLVSREQRVEGVIQFFGDLLFVIQLADQYDGQPIHCGYQIDPFREADTAEMRQPEFDDDIVPIFDEQPRGIDEGCFAILSSRLGRIIQGYYDRADQKLVQEVIDEVLSPHTGEPFTEELAARFSQLLAERFVARLAERAQGDEALDILLD